MFNELQVAPATANVGDNVWGFLSHCYQLLITDQLLDYLPHILLAIILGALIGFERRYRQKAAGVRTHLLISASAALITVCGVIITSKAGLGDPTRLAHSVLAGIGFIGAGVILKRGISTQGVTTAATIFLAAAVGVACGFGMFALATGTTLLMILALTLTTRFLSNSERCFPVIVTCHADRLAEVRGLFGVGCKVDGFERKGDNLVEITIEPELTVHQYTALVERLLDNQAVLRCEPIGEHDK